MPEASTGVTADNVKSKLTAAGYSLRKAVLDSIGIGEAARSKEAGIKHRAIAFDEISNDLLEILERDIAPFIEGDAATRKPLLVKALSGMMNMVFAGLTVAGSLPVPMPDLIDEFDMSIKLVAQQRAGLIEKTI